MKIFNTILITLVVRILLIGVSLIFFDVSIRLKTHRNDEQNKNMQKDGLKQNPDQKITKLKTEILQQGKGDVQVKTGDTITVHYTGTLINGVKFDSSLDRGTPFSLTIGVGQVIRGWDQGIIGMRVGEQRKLTIPSQLAYGAVGAGGVIPPNADLIFVVDLISINNKGEVEEKNHETQGMQGLENEIEPEKK